MLFVHNWPQDFGLTPKIDNDEEERTQVLTTEDLLQKEALFGVRLDEGREGRDVLIFLKSFVVAYFKSLKNVDLNKNFGKEVNSYYL